MTSSRCSVSGGPSASITAGQANDSDTRTSVGVATKVNGKTRQASGFSSPPWVACTRQRMSSASATQRLPAPPSASMATPPPRAGWMAARKRSTGTRPVASRRKLVALAGQTAARSSRRSSRRSPCTCSALRRATAPRARSYASYCAAASCTRSRSVSSVRRRAPCSGRSRSASAARRATRPARRCSDTMSG